MLSTRAEILNPETISMLNERVRFLSLFQKNTWPEYLGLLVQLYDAIEGRNAKLPYSEALNIAERFFFDKNLQNPDQKNFSIVAILINELNILKEVFEGGVRYVDTNREGKQLLHWMSELSRNRPQFTGSGAETLMAALHAMVADPRELTVDEAILRHKQTIQSYSEDILRIQQRGVHASELLNPGVSFEELFQRADDEASRILLAAEDVKVAIETARKELTQRYLDSRFSAGDAIEFIADYSEVLRGKPEYQSYRRAKEILSHIEGVGSFWKSKGLDSMIYDLEKKNLIAHPILNRSTIYRFSEQFQSAVASIENKYREQLYLLKVQVQYALSGNSKQTREELMALHALFLKKRDQVIEYLIKFPYEANDTLPFELGILEVDRLERREDLELPGVTENGLEVGEGNFAIIELIRQSEEATVDRVLKRLQTELDQHGSVKLSEYPIILGLPEFYVLSQVECFSSSIRATELGLSNIKILGPLIIDRSIELLNVINYQYEIK